MLLFFINCSNKPTTEGTDKKILDCEYSPVLEMLGGDPECKKLYCQDLESKCTYDNGEKKKEGILCPAIKNSEGGWTCPKAYDCLVAKTPEYDEDLNNYSVLLFNPNCDGVVLNGKTDN